MSFLLFPHGCTILEKLNVIMKAKIKQKRNSARTTTITKEYQGCMRTGTHMYSVDLFVLKDYFISKLQDRRATLG